ncbi:Bug family tripartite tricarboxylate transporter substrate binding protein [Ramlibacter agri]|uniref:Bug family tripartite tricarboxylate transporter substrate binding protein n=1 Tax=Ramlibacter agri TaxID=2728837 RepID=UPI001F0CE3B8|nr:tripartite tricarboxylate transporter substrate binding protein [Ramlibacter agri]
MWQLRRAFHDKTRLIAKKLGDNIGATVLVDNRAGAGGNIAHQLVANGPADGSLILLGSIGPLTIAPHMMKVGYDPFKDLAPLSGGVYFPNMLVVNKESGIQNLADFIAAAKKSPGSVTFASTGSGSASHLAGELFAQRIGAEMTHVPYKGGAPAMQDLLANRFTGYLAAPPTALPHVESGKLIPLATTGLTRPAYLPNIPTVAEAGLPGFEALNWYAFVASEKMPAPLLDRWNQEIVKVLKDPEIRDALSRHGLTPHPTTRAELTEFMQKESAKWGAIVRERKISAE